MDNKNLIKLFKTIGYKGRSVTEIWYRNPLEIKSKLDQLSTSLGQRIEQQIRWETDEGKKVLGEVRKFIKDEAFSGEDKIIRKYLKPDLLIIDDMGLKQLPRSSGEHLFEVIMRRYETRSTVMTSNRPIEEWGKLIGDVPAAGAILDRFLHHAEIINIKGKSYRLKDKSKK